MNEQLVLLLISINLNYGILCTIRFHHNSFFVRHCMCLNPRCLFLVLITLLWLLLVSCSLPVFVVEGRGSRGSILAGYPSFVSSSCWAGADWCHTDLDSYCSAVCGPFARYWLYEEKYRFPLQLNTSLTKWSKLDFVRDEKHLANFVCRQAFHAIFLFYLCCFSFPLRQLKLTLPVN